MGLERDKNFRLSKPREYLGDLVQIAQKAIYEQARAVSGSVIDKLLKATSSVPTKVDIWFNSCMYSCADLFIRMHSSNVLGRPSPFQKC